MAEGIINGEDQVPVGTIDKFEGHGSRAVVGIFGAAGRAELGVAAERDKFEAATMRAAIHGAAVGRVTTMNDLINIFQNDRPGSKVIFDDFIIIS